MYHQAQTQLRGLQTFLQLSVQVLTAVHHLGFGDTYESFFDLRELEEMPCISGFSGLFRRLESGNVLLPSW